MDALTAAIYARLSGDAQLAALVSSVTQGWAPQNPKGLAKPQVVFRAMGVGVDVAGIDGHHGAAMDATVEVEVWGHQETAGADLLACKAAASRVSLLMLDAVQTSSGGQTCRPAENPGWQQVDDTDPYTVHLHNGWSLRYWSAERLAALTS